MDDFLAIFVVAGLLLSALLRVAVSETVGEHVSIPDRLAGSVLGAVRIALLAVLMVVIFDRIIPSGRDPPFLAGSRLRPLLSMAGAQGLKTLPPDVADYIDRLKREPGEFQDGVVGSPVRGSRLQVARRSLNGGFPRACAAQLLLCNKFPVISMVYQPI